MKITKEITEVSAIEIVLYLATYISYLINKCNFDKKTTNESQDTLVLMISVLINTLGVPEEEIDKAILNYIKMLEKAKLLNGKNEMTIIEKIVHSGINDATA